jgi:hypothetical protein
MDDAQSPPDSNSGKGDRPTDRPADRASDKPADRQRASSLRLRDAESVATTRRDMFGDGSLLNTMQGSPSASEGRAADEAPPAPDFVKSLDAIIDSFPAEPASREPAPHETAWPSDTAFPPPPLNWMEIWQRSRGPVNGASGRADGGAQEPPSSDAGAPAPGAVGAEARGTVDAAEGRDGDRGPQRTGQGTAAPQGGGAGGTAAGDAAVSGEPRARPEERSMSPFDGAAGIAPLPEPMNWPPFPERRGAEGDAQHAEAPGPPPAEELNTTEAGAPFPEPFDTPPFPEPHPAATRTAFSEPRDAPAYPPHPTSDLPQHPTSAHLPYSQPLDMPPFPEPQATATAPPYPESWDDAPADAPDYIPSHPTSAHRPYPEPREVPRFADEHGATPSREEPDPLFSQSSFHSAFDSAAQVSAEATAKIAAEATATADALENLKRLLKNSVPDPDAPLRSPLDPSLNLRPDSSAYVPNEPPPLLPLPLPPPAPTTGKGVYLLGFLTGLALSLAAGLALYFVITTI